MCPATRRHAGNNPTAPQVHAPKAEGGTIWRVFSKDLMSLTRSKFFTLLLKKKYSATPGRVLAKPVAWRLSGACPQTGAGIPEGPMTLSC